MTRREVFMIDNPDAHVAYREQIIANSTTGDAIRSYSDHLLLAIAQYSRGDTLEIVRATVRKSVLFLENDPKKDRDPFLFSDPSQYYLAIWGLSLSMLFGDASLAFLHRGVGQDAIYDQLLKRTGALVAPVQTLTYPNPFHHLLKVIETPKESESELDDFLKEWYDGMALTQWHDTHLEQDPSFFGYWSFELAAVVKAYDISDKSFVTNIFYPRDLVHQRLFRTWLDSPEGETDRAANAVIEAQKQLEIAKDLLLNFFSGDGTGSDKDAESLGQSLKTISALLGLTPESVQENPEILRLGMLKIFSTIATISKDALRMTDGKSDPEKEKVWASIRDLEKQLGKNDPDFEALTNAIADQENYAAQNINPEVAKTEGRDRLNAMQGAMEKLLQDQAIELEGIFSGLEKMSNEFSTQLGIKRSKGHDVQAEVSEKVGRALDEAGKKNMIQDDFDWSSLWRKN